MVLLHGAMMRKQQRPKPKNAVLKNPLTNEMISCTIIGEDSIEDVSFLIVQMNGRVVKLAKEAYKIMERK